MSTRGINFLHQWLTDDLPEIENPDYISVAELAQKMIVDAEAIGISSTETEEETGSVYEAVLDAIVHSGAGAPE